jgi:hypothetical protein
MSEIWIKITKCSENNFKVGKQGMTWDNSDTCNNATWDNSKSILKGNLRFLVKNCHNFLLTTPFCMNKNFPCSLRF